MRRSLYIILASFIALLATSSPSAKTLEITAAPMKIERGAQFMASRSGERAPAVKAPNGSSKKEKVGVNGIKPVAKPKPRPKPVATNKPSPSVPQTNRNTTAVPPSGKCSGIGVSPSAQSLCSAIYANFNPPTIGGYRAGGGDHSAGKAIDVMVYGNSGLGSAVSAFVQANYGNYNVSYLIWQQKYWAPGRGWKLMEDRGSPTENHMDHVHISFN